MVPKSTVAGWLTFLSVEHLEISLGGQSAVNANFYIPPTNVFEGSRAEFPSLLPGWRFVVIAKFLSLFLQKSFPTLPLFQNLPFRGWRKSRVSVKYLNFNRVPSLNVCRLEAAAIDRVRSVGACTRADR